MIKAIFFDYDDVLTKYPSFSPFSKELSPLIEKSREEIAQAFQKFEPQYIVGRISNKQFWDAFATELNIQPQYDLFNKKFLARSHLNKPLIKLIEKLRRVKCGIISDNYEEMKGEINKLRDLFEVIILSCDVGATKRTRHPFTRAMKSLGVHASECIFIDNNEKNLHEARKLGMITIHYVADGRHSFNKLKRDLRELDVLD